MLFSKRLDLCQDTSLPVPIIGNILRLLRNRRLFRIALIVSMALGIAGINEASSDPSSSTGTSLRKASAVLFLVLTIVQVLQTLVLIKAEHEGVLKSFLFVGEQPLIFLFQIVILTETSHPPLVLLMLLCYLQSSHYSFSSVKFSLWLRSATSLKQTTSISGILLSPYRKSFVSSSLAYPVLFRRGKQRKMRACKCIRMELFPQNTVVRKEQVLL